MTGVGITVFLETTGFQHTHSVDTKKAKRRICLDFKV